MNDAQLIEVATSWSSKLPERSAEIEAARRLPQDIAEGFIEAGLFHAVVPKQYGGFEVHPSTFIELIKQIAIGDGSAGWNLMIGLTTSLLSASLPKEFVEEIFGDKPGVLTVGVTAPLGRAELVEGGYRVTGRWPFGSGSSNADWICGGTLIMENGAPREGKNGAPELHLMMFKKDQVQIEDTWHVSGLSGTGSHHYHVENQFVPAGRSVVMGGRPRITTPLYQFPMLGLLAMGVSSVSLGIGYKALAAFKELSGVKTPTGSVRPLANRAQVQSMVAESIADLQSAEVYIHSVIDEAYAVAERGERLTPDMKSRLRLAAANATHRSVAAVDRLYQAGGGSSIYQESELQRCFRDVHVTTQHLMVAAPIYEVIGRVQLGLEPKALL